MGGDSAEFGLVTLPGRSASWGADAESAVMEPAPPGPVVRSGQIKVLLVEDHPGDAQLVKLALHLSQSPFFAISHAMTLADALRQAVEAEPDVVLLDLNLPDSTGIETVSRMQAAVPKLPIVIMTGLEDPEFANHALEMGAQDYLVKGEDVDRSVIRAIRYAITRKTAEVERQTLAERLEQQQRRLMQEIAAARAMQFDLLPRPERIDPLLRRLGLSVESCFEPSSGIGGDLWGCLDCGLGRMGFYTFDFSGHGVQAALNVFRFHAMIADRWEPSLRPAAALRVLGAGLRSLLTRGQYATMFLAIVDVEQSVLDWASAGAPPPLVVESGRIGRLDAHGMPLGLSDDAEYGDHRRPFVPGSSLFLFSDALTDAFAGDQPFGEDGVLELAETVVAEEGKLKVGALLSKFYDRVAAPLVDDLTAVCISRPQGA